MLIFSTHIRKQVIFGKDGFSSRTLCTRWVLKKGPLKATGYNGGKSSASFQNGFAESYLFCCCWLGLFYCNIIKLKLCFCYLRKKEELRSLLEAADEQTCSPVMYEKSPQRESRLLLELVGFGQHFSHPPVAFIFCKRNEL